MRFVELPTTYLVGEHYLSSPPFVFMILRDENMDKKVYTHVKQELEEGLILETKLKVMRG